MAYGYRNNYPLEKKCIYYSFVQSNSIGTNRLAEEILSRIMTPIWDMLLTGVVSLPSYAFIIYLLIYVGKFLIAVVSFPVALRLSAELFKQVLKYRNIVRTYRDDDDVGQYRAYYTHFKIVYCLLLSLIVYITFTVVSCANATYMLALAYELGKYSYEHTMRTIVYFLTHNNNEGIFNNRFIFISLPTNNYVMYSIAAFRGLGENAIMLFAAILIYQIVCYIQKYNFSFWFWVKLFSIRAVFILFSKLNFVFWILTSITDHFSVNPLTSDKINAFFLPFPLLRKSFELFENVILTVMSFVLMRVAFKTIKIKEIENRENQLIVEEVGWDNINKVGIAIRLFKIFTVGYFFTALVMLVVNFLECHFIYLLASLSANYNSDSFTETEVSIGIIAGILSFLPTLLYIIFLWKLWFYLGSFLRKNPYRYRREDFYDLSTLNAPKLDSPHFTKLPNQDRIILAHHLLISLITSLLVAGLCSQFLHIRWAAPLTLQPGDYVFMNETKSDLSCDGKLEYSLTYAPTTHLDPIPFTNRINLENETCFESILFYSKPLESFYFDQTVNIANISDTYYIDLWLPNGTSFQYISSCVGKMRVIVRTTPYPCYILPERIYTLLPDKLCYKYQESLNSNGLPPLNINNSICKVDESLCKTAGVGISSIDVSTEHCINESIELRLKRVVYRGGNSSVMCTLRNISYCDPGNIQLITHKPKNLYYPKKARSGINMNACQFSAICYYNTWIPIIASVCIFLLTLFYGIGTIIIIHRYFK